MKIFRKCPVCKLDHYRELPVTQHEIELWTTGKLAQDLWPTLSADDREFIISGTHSLCWDKILGEENEDI